MSTFSREEPYRVRLPVFEGPLDLLLQLIEREKLDISGVSLAQVADQFLSTVRQMQEVAAGDLADFLVVAVKLVWIKSRLLLPQPRPPAEDDDGIDPAEALAAQLREYKRFKEAAQTLRLIEEAGLRTYLRAAPPPELEHRLDPQGGSLSELLAAARLAFAAAPAGPLDIPEGMVVPFMLTIHDQIVHIREVTAGGRAVTFRTLLTQAHHRLEIIVTLLAVLELVKRQAIRVVQDAAFGEITIEGVEGASFRAEDDEPDENGEG
ncbi:MAG: segregation and condensation protein A [Nitrososphaerales archaeon]